MRWRWLLLGLMMWIGASRTSLADDAKRMAASADGRYMAVAYDNPPQLAILDADRRVLKALSTPSRVVAVFDAARRRSFVVAFDGALELWEVSYDPKAEPIAEGVVHDFRLKEGAFVEGFLNPRRTRLDQPVDNVSFVAEGSIVVGRQREDQHCVVIQLDVRRAIARLAPPC